MAQAMQAKAEVLRLQSGGGALAQAAQPCAPASANSATDMPLISPISLTTAMPLPGQGRRMDGETADTTTTAPSLQDNARTTIMLRNLPNDYSRQMLLDLLDENGFQSSYDFVYLPMDVKRKVGLGYAFVNMLS